jgi:hypothetical protein
MGAVAAMHDDELMALRHEAATADFANEAAQRASLGRSRDSGLRGYETAP